MKNKYKSFWNVFTLNGGLNVLFPHKIKIVLALKHKKGKNITELFQLIFTIQNIKVTMNVF